MVSRRPVDSIRGRSFGSVHDVDHAGVPNTTLVKENSRFPLSTREGVWPNKTLLTYLGIY
jgi:hypothetical protein